MKHCLLYIFVALAIALLPSAVEAQQRESALKFHSTVGDYGHIPEDGGSVVCRFEAVNSGTEPVAIVDVITSCGCTSVAFDRKPIAAGESTTLDIRFDPMNRPGRIDRTVYLRTTDFDGDIRLSLVGEVTPRDKSVEELYPFDMGGGLRLATNHHTFTYIEHGKAIEERIGYINSSDKAITIALSPIRSSGALTVTYPKWLEAGASGDIIIRYRLSLESSRYGTLNDEFRFAVDGVGSEHIVTTQAIAVDNFDLYDDISTPRGVIPKNIIKFGEVNRTNDFLERSFTIVNEGQSSLFIRKVESSSSAIRAIVEQGAKLKPGETLKITVRLYPAYIGDSDLPFTGRITLTTNDMLQPMKLIRVNAIPVW